MKKSRIVIVDDEADFADALRNCIADESREVVVFTDSIEMLKALDEPADLLIADLLMPWLDGATLVKKAYLMYPRMEVLVVSGSKKCETVMKELGTNTPYFHKPFNTNEIRGAVSDALDRVHAR